MSTNISTNSFDFTEEEELSTVNDTDTVLNETISTLNMGNMTNEISNNTEANDVSIQNENDDEPILRLFQLYLLTQHLEEYPSS